MQEESAWTTRYIEGANIGNSPPSWLESSYRKFETTVLTEGYPCYFGAQLVRSGGLYLASVDRESIATLPQTIATFTFISASLHGHRNNLAVFFRPFDVQLSHKRYCEVFWHVLRYLQDHNPLPDTLAAAQTEHPHWEFSFAAEQFFVVGASPSYRNRRSRNLGPGLVMLFQPRDVFEHVDPGDLTDYNARQIIRKRLMQNDRVGPHPDLGFYGDPENLEWKQYFLPDGPDRVTGRCPLNTRSFPRNRDSAESC